MTTKQTETQEMLAELRKALGTMNDIADRANSLLRKLESQAPAVGDAVVLHPRDKERRLKAGVLVWMLRRYDALPLPSFDVASGEAQAVLFAENCLMGVAELAVEAMDILDEPRRAYTDDDYTPTEGE